MTKAGNMALIREVSEVFVVAHLQASVSTNLPHRVTMMNTHTPDANDGEEQPALPPLQKGHHKNEHSRRFPRAT